MAQKNYTSFYEIRIDLGLYLALRSGDPITLDLLPAITKDRYFWFVSNWTKYFQQFKTFTQGNEELEAALADFDRSVTSTNLGNPANVLANADKLVLYSPFFALISTTDIKPNKDEQDYIRTEIKRVQAFDISTFRSMIDYLQVQHNLTCQYLGLGDADAAKLRNETVAPKKRTANVDDLVILDQALELENFIEGIIINFKNTQGKSPNLLTIANNNLSPDTDFAINDAFRSYIAIPFEKSLASMAYKYLGSADLWFELVTVNNLKPPYVDLYGQKSFLISSGSGSTITIADTYKERINVGSKLSLGSIKQKEQQRIIEKINDNKDGTLTIFLSGEKNLSLFKTTEKAFARIYYYGTVNESSLIYIPIEVSSPLSKVITPESDDLRRLDLQTLAFGVDIQRDETTGDIALDATGDFQKCVGVANVRQTIRHVLRTEVGENQWHPTYGITTAIGNEWFATLPEAQIIAENIQSSILQDDRFKNLVITNLTVENNSMHLAMVTVLRDSSVPIPLSFVE